MADQTDKTRSLTAAIRAALAKVRALPPSFLWPAVGVGAVIILVAAHAAFDHHTSTTLASTPPAASAPATKAKATAARTAAQQTSGAPASATGSNVPTFSGSPASASTAALAAPAVNAAASAPVTQPPGVKAGLVGVVTEGQDQFGAWLILHSSVVSTPKLQVTVPVKPAGDAGVRRIIYTTWIHVTHPVATVTLRAVGGMGPVSATIAGHTVTAEPSWGSDGAFLQQQVVSLAPGWYKVRIAGEEHRNRGFQEVTTRHVELELGSADLNPAIPQPWWTPSSAKPASASSAAPAAASSVATAPASASTAPAAASTADGEE